MRLLKTTLITPAHPRRQVAPFLKQGRRATKARGVLYHGRREGLSNQKYQARPPMTNLGLPGTKWISLTPVGSLRRRDSK